jgi:hypothetical protein
MGFADGAISRKRVRYQIRAVTNQILPDQRLVLIEK